MVREIDCPTWGERWLHGRFAHLNIQGEWFRFAPEMLTISVPQFMPCMEEIYGWNWGRRTKDSSKLKAQQKLRKKKGKAA